MQYLQMLQMILSQTSILSTRYSVKVQVGEELEALYFIRILDFQCTILILSVLRIRSSEFNSRCQGHSAFPSVRFQLAVVKPHKIDMPQPHFWKTWDSWISNEGFLLWPQSKSSILLGHVAYHNLLSIDIFWDWFISPFLCTISHVHHSLMLDGRNS